MYNGIEMGLREGMVVTLFSMAVVFVALIVISYTIDIMRFFVNRDKN